MYYFVVLGLGLEYYNSIQYGQMANLQKYTLIIDSMSLSMSEIVYCPCLSLFHLYTP